jgi:ankyrin repeat protein
MNRNSIIAAALLLAVLSAGCPLIKPPGPAPLTQDRIDRFFLAAKSGDLGQVQAMLADRPDLVNAHESVYGLTALHGAVYSNRIDLAALLITHGADVNARSNSGNPPLIEAAARNYTDLAAFLIQNGADVNAQNAKGDVPLHWAAHAGSLETARVLLQHGANPNVRNQDGNTPLSIAVVKKRQPMIDLLKKAGAKP